MKDSADAYQQVDTRTRVARKIGMSIAFVFIFVLLVLRFQQCPSVNDDELASAYAGLCEAIEGQRTYDSLYEETRDLLRAGGTRVETHFIYELVRRMNGEPPVNDHLEPIEAPLREHLRNQDFESARQIVRTALVEDAEMTRGRADQWRVVIEEMELRTEHGCRYEAASESP